MLVDKEQVENQDNEYIILNRNEYRNIIIERSYFKHKKIQFVANSLLFLFPNYRCISNDLVL